MIADEIAVVGVTILAITVATMRILVVAAWILIERCLIYTFQKQLMLIFFVRSYVHWIFGFSNFEFRWKYLKKHEWSCLMRFLIRLDTFLNHTAIAASWGVETTVSNIVALIAVEEPSFFKSYIIFDIFRRAGVSMKKETLWIFWLTHKRGDWLLDQQIFRCISGQEENMHV